MNIASGRKILASTIVLMILAGCTSANHWRPHQAEPQTRFVCNVQGMTKDCVRISDSDFNRVVQRLQPRRL